MDFRILLQDARGEKFRQISGMPHVQGNLCLIMSRVIRFSKIHRNELKLSKNEHELSKNILKLSIHELKLSKIN